MQWQNTSGCRVGSCNLRDMCTVESEQALYEGFRDYIPRPYSGKLTLLRAQTGPLLRGRTPDFGWSRFVSNVDIRPIPGSHETIFQPPHVSELARQLLGLMEDLP